MKFETRLGFLLGSFVLFSKIIFGLAGLTPERGGLKPFFESDTSFYHISGNKATHKEAYAGCKAYKQGYYLVVIENEAERKIIADELEKLQYQKVWVALEKSPNNILVWNYPNGTVQPNKNQNIQSVSSKNNLRQRRNVLESLGRNVHGSNATPIDPGACPLNVNINKECQVKNCNVTLPDCSISTPDCKVGPSVCTIDEQPECTASCKECTVMVQPICYAQPKPCNVTLSGECTITEASCTVTTPPCTVTRLPCNKPTQPPCTSVTTPVPCTTVEPCIPDCTNGTCTCPYKVCHQEEIVCPPVSMHCPPPVITCPDPIVTCKEPEVVCPDPVSHCPDPEIVCTEAQVHCSAPIVNCPPVVHTCAQPELNCPQPNVTCPPAEVDCPDDGSCTPGPVTTPAHCTTTTPLPPTTTPPETCYGCDCCYLDNYQEFLTTECNQKFHYVCEKRK